MASGIVIKENPQLAQLCRELGIRDASALHFLPMEEAVLSAFAQSTVPKTYKHTVLALACFNGGVEMESFLIRCARTGIELPTTYAVAKSIAKDNDYDPRFNAEAEEILREARSIVAAKDQKKRDIERQEARRKYENHLEATSWN